ncbi:hypothetical protein BF93_18090 [Brachybacterium phenoliresistens]|uniref:Fe/B12 periplasmic-binding domain-containing protein n=1 Tax=Brachybacterium phenoliresistens TaxID=396014 RepID=Z9JU23_9MICO|nr:ABC transporter substrate-binding protein [Brachybacterium phenoliresistens]EWS81267.1 hypothetical protein BF93_18090 [Brachybacterium phenoliresistens]
MTAPRFSRRLALSGAGLGLAGLGLAACGTTDPATDATTGPASGSGADQASGDAGTVTVTSGDGTEVEVPANPTGVAGLEWSVLEDIIAVGGPLTGATDIEGYTAWGTSTAPIPAGVTELGTRREPSIETIATLAPDVIIGTDSSIPETALDQVQQIAPVLTIQAPVGDRPIEIMQENHRTVGLAVGRPDQAEENLQAYEARLAEAKEQLAGVTGSFVFVNASENAGQILFRMHGTRSLAGAVADAAGLTNGFTDPGDDAWGLGSWDLEAMVANLPDDATILSWTDPADDQVAASLTGQSAWESIPAVAEGRLHNITQMWPYGGPIAMIRWLDLLVETLA